MIYLPENYPRLESIIRRLILEFDGGMLPAQLSGGRLVTAAKRGGLTLIAVTLNAPDDWNDHKRMLDYGFSIRESVELVGETGLTREVPVVGGVSDRVTLAAAGPVDAVLPKGEHTIRAVYEIRRFYYAPVAAGELLGRAVFYDGDEKIASLPLTAAGSVEAAKPKGLWARLRALFGG